MLLPLAVILSSGDEAVDGRTSSLLLTFDPVTG